MNLIRSCQNDLNADKMLLLESSADAGFSDSKKLDESFYNMGMNLMG
jgi:hypothetical protein